MLFHYKNQKIFAFSDTHSMEYRLEIPPDTDILVCVGDGINGFSEREFVHFVRWYAPIPDKLRLFVAGNHEIFFDFYPQKAKSLIPPEITLLENSGIHFADIYFHSVAARPYLKTPTQIPDNVDFLLTHAPIKGVLDSDIGCPDLRDLVMTHRPKFHLFGHIHQHGLQQIKIEETTFCNVSYFNFLSEAIVNDFSAFLNDKNIL